MSALDEYLEREKSQPDLYDDEGWKLLEQARSELTQLRATIAQQAAQLEQTHELLTTLEWNDWDERVNQWIATYDAQHAQASPDQA